MAHAANPIPEGYGGAIPYLSTAAAAKALDFYRTAFGAVETERLTMPDGRIGHAEITIGGARVMLADEFPDMDFRSPTSLGGSPVMIHVYVPDVDALVRQATAAGAVVERATENTFYGDRVAGLRDPFGHRWHFATRIENLTSEEIRRRATAAHGA